MSTICPPQVERVSEALEDLLADNDSAAIPSHALAHCAPITARRFSAPPRELDAPPRDLDAPARELDAPPRQKQPAAYPLDHCGPLLPDPSLSWTLARRVMRTTAPLLAADVLGLMLAGLVARAALLLALPDAGTALGWTAPVALLPVLFAYWLSDLYAEVWVHPVVELRQLTHLTSIGLLAAALGGLLAPGLPIWCLAVWPVAVVLVPLFRRAARRLCANRGWWGYPTLVIGSGDAAPIAAMAVMDVPTSGLRPVLVSDPEGGCRVAGIPVCNDPAQLESLVRAQAIRHAVVSLPQFSPARLGEVLDRYGGLVPHLLVMSDASTLPSLWGASRNCGRLSGIEVRNALMLATLQSVKRAIDVTIAIMVFVVSLPFLPIVVFLVNRSGPGPAFYGHTRIGQHGRLFTALKFRTMHENGDAILGDYFEQNPQACQEWKRDHKLRNDPRVTAIGGFLRRTSLDELPQVWNVLKGDMSLVGPRPIVQDEICRYGDRIRLYAKIKPGITGLWQVSGRTDTTYDDRVQLDLFYIRHWSPWLDAYILAKTIVALVSRDGAY